MPIVGDKAPIGSQSGKVRCEGRWTHETRAIAPRKGPNRETMPAIAPGAWFQYLTVHNCNQLATNCDPVLTSEGRAGQLCIIFRSRSDANCITCKNFISLFKICQTRLFGLVFGTVSVRIRWQTQANGSSS